MLLLFQSLISIICLKYNFEVPTINILEMYHHNTICSMEAIHIKGKAVTLNAILHCMQNHCALFSQLGEIEHWDNCPTDLEYITAKSSN